jgi:hypothetical protein
MPWLAERPGSSADNGAAGLLAKETFSDCSNNMDCFRNMRDLKRMHPSSAT